jgi:WD40 repeat protein
MQPEIAPTDPEATVPPAAPAEQATLPPHDVILTLDYSESAPALRNGVAVPGYEILRELGRGGMGVVYQARHTKLDRVVALKMILVGGHAGEADLARFKTEAESVARLQHPHIVQIFEVGEHAGLPFFSLEYCPGGSLDKKLNGTPLPPKEAAQLVETLARAMYAAHQANVIHRDLKPANILLTEDGSPKITDFGLAKKLDDAGQTQSGAIMGTPSYMAPEQAGGKGQAVGPGADVYALGAILYELLTGRPPFKAATPLDTVMQVVMDDPVPPTRLQPKTPRDVETICLKCLRKEPSRRYATAAELADDLGRFREGRPVLARPLGRVARVAKWARRRPALATLLAVSAAAVLGAIVLLDAARRQANERNTAEAALRGDVEVAQVETRRQLDRVRGLLFTSQLRRIAPLIEHDPTQALDLLGDQDACPTELRDFAWGYYHHLASRDRGTLAGHVGAIGALAVSPDGSTLASAGPDGKSGTQVMIWDVATAKARGASFSCDGKNVAAIAFSPDGRWLAVAANGLGPFKANPLQAPVTNMPGAVTLCPVDDPGARRTLPGSPSFISALAFTAKGDLVTAAGQGGTVWEVASGKEHASWTCPPIEGPQILAPSVCTLARFSADGRLVATAIPSYSIPKGAAQEKYPVRVFEVATGQLLAEATDTSLLAGLILSPDGRWLVLNREKLKPTSLYDRREPRPQAHPLPNMISGLRFSPDSRVLTGLNVLHHYDVPAFAAVGAGIFGLGGSPLVQWPILAHSTTMAAEAGLPNVGMILWDVAAGRELARFDAPKGESVTFTPDGKGLFVLSSPLNDKKVLLHDARTGQLLLAFHHVENRHEFFPDFGPQCLAITPDSRTVAVAISRPSYESQDFSQTPGAMRPGLIRLWDFSSLDSFTTSPVGGGTTGLLTQDGNEAALLNRAGVELRSVADGKLLSRVQNEDAWLWRLSPDGEFVVNQTPVKKIEAGGLVQSPYIVRRTRTGQVVANIPPSTTVNPVLAFRPDNRALAILVTNQPALTAPPTNPPPAQQTLSVRGLPDGSTLGSVAIPSGNTVRGGVFSPGGREAAVALRQEIGLADFETGQYRTLANKLSTGLAPTTMAWSTDGKRLAFADNADILVWTRPEPGRDSAAVRLPPGHHQAVTAFAFSPDGKTLASADGESVRLWDVATSQERAALSLPPGPGAMGGLVIVTSSLTFTPDGRELRALQPLMGRVVRWRADAPDSSP